MPQYRWQYIPRGQKAFGSRYADLRRCTRCLSSCYTDVDRLPILSHVCDRLSLSLYFCAITCLHRGRASAWSQARLCEMSHPCVTSLGSCPCLSVRNFLTPALPTVSDVPLALLCSLLLCLPYGGVVKPSNLLHAGLARHKPLGAGSMVQTGRARGRRWHGKGQSQARKETERRTRTGQLATIARTWLLAGLFWQMQGRHVLPRRGGTHGHPWHC